VNRWLALLTIACLPALAAERQLFNGKDLTGWARIPRHEGAPAGQKPGFVVENGLLVSIPDAPEDDLWYTGGKIGNATLRVVYKVSAPDANSGIFTRIPYAPKSEDDAIDKGIEVQIQDSADEYHCTGVLYSMTKAMARPYRPAGEWNTLEITMRGPRTVVRLNGVVVTDYDGVSPVPPKKGQYEPERGPRPDSGYIAVQHHGGAATVWFREIALVEGGGDCDKLTGLTLAAARIDSAKLVPAGAFAPPTGRAEPYRNVPEFCRVAATLTPSADSDIKAEFWLPAAGWNGRLQVVGNGGWAGTISYGALAQAVRDGYAAASTDTGHSTPGAAFVLGHPEKLVDFSWRSEHETTVKAKAVVEAFYGVAARRSYWNGCSTGGRQALKEAQMFPDDFDGIIAGAPGNRTAQPMWVAEKALKDPAARIPPAKFPAIHRAALEACDASDGLRDGLISDPERCGFDPVTLLCKGGDAPDCLTAPQVEAARAIYTAPKDPRTGKPLFGTLAPGSELGWAVMAGGPEPYAPTLDQLKYVVYADPNWDWRSWDAVRDNDRYLKPEYLIMNATDPHIEKFVAHGGKLLLYHGWADQNVSPYNTVQYFDRVRETLGPEKTDSAVRLFMAPGMGHCGGGEGPNTFDKIGPLDRWVEQGEPPASLLASHSTAGKVDQTRPLCPYPQQAKPPISLAECRRRTNPFPPHRRLIFRHPD
jgi:feruloyl esterase